MLRSLWSAYRANGDSVCARCLKSAHLVAAVRYAPRGYQLMCSLCGWGTPWFDVQDGEVALLGLDRFGRRTEGGRE